MRMTIDTAITVLGMVEAHGICIEAKDLAVDTMRKYQKIVDIYYHQRGDALENSLRAVIEDGKID